MNFQQEEYEVAGGKGSTAHFVWCCGLCLSSPSPLDHLPMPSLCRLGKRESSAKFDPSPPRPYTDENCQFTPMLIIECRGLEFVGFDPQVR